MPKKKLLIKTALVPLQLPQVPHGYANGYVGVPPEHPWFGKDYDEVSNAVCVHGGLTYSADHCPLQEPDGFWWLGFDTAHYGDTLDTCPRSCLTDPNQNPNRGMPGGWAAAHTLSFASPLARLSHYGTSRNEAGNVLKWDRPLSD